MECVATKTMARWLPGGPGGGGGSIPGSPSPLISVYKIHTREKVRKGEGEPGDEANTLIH